MFSYFDTYTKGEYIGIPKSPLVVEFTCVQKVMEWEAAIDFICRNAPLL